MKSRYIIYCRGFLQGGSWSFFPILTIILFTTLLVLTFLRLFYQSHIDTDNLIAQDIVTLKDIFHRIDESCTILDFDNPKNPIDFLNVIKFVGSQVGSMKLAYPDKWLGPYLETNPTMQGKEYQIVKTNKGYLIMPGDGVILGNGKVIGKDIIIDENTDIDSLLKSDQGFLSHGKPLASLLSLQHSMMQELLLENVERVEEE